MSTDLEQIAAVVSNEVVPSKQITKNYGLVESVEQLSQFVDKLVKDNLVVSVDIETGYLGPAKEKAALRPEDPASMIVGVSFTNSEEWARYIPLAHDLGNNLDIAACAELLWKLFWTVPIIAFNGKFELRFFRVWFKKYLVGAVWDEAAKSDFYFPLHSDPMIECYVAQTTPAYGLKYITEYLTGHKQTELMDLFPGLAKNKAKTLRFNSLTLEPHVTAYACEDAVWSLSAHHYYHPKVKDRFIYKTEMALLLVVCRMEDYGVLYDWNAMETDCVKAEIFLEKYDAEIQKDLSELAGKPILINLGSPKQLREVLYGDLGMKSAKLTNTGLESTGAIAMEALSKKHPVVRKILDYKEVKKLIESYLTKYPREYTYAEDGHAHPNHLQCNVISGRFALSDPNYQQSSKGFIADIPDLGPTRVSHYYQLDSGDNFHVNFRDYIVAPNEHVILGYDYSQVELRVLAGEAQEPYLIKAFDDGEDIHKAAASLMFNVPINEIDKKQRDKAKTLQFALLYGMGVKSLSDRLAISRDEAQALYDKYFSTFSSVAAFVERATASAVKNGYAESRFGRTPRIWELLSTDHWTYSRGERMAVNLVCQGTAADYMKVAMVRANTALGKAGLLDRVHLVMNIHDALEYYVHESVDVQEVISTLFPAISFKLPGYPSIKADWHWGWKWGSVEEIEVDGQGRIMGDLAPLAPRPAATPKPAPGTLRALRPSKAATAPSGTLVVEIKAMPTKEQFSKFSELIVSRPGKNEIRLETPQGPLLLKIKTSLTPKHEAQIAMSLPTAVVSWDVDRANLESLTEGLML